MQNYQSQIGFCPACGHENQPSFKYCNHCGLALPPAAALETSVLKKKRSSFPLILLISLVVMGSCGGLAAVAVLMRDAEADRSQPNSSPSPELTQDSQAITEQQLRDMFAATLQSNLRASGCANCTVGSIAGLLILTHPGVPPRDAAGQVLGETKTKKVLKELGFTTLRVKQSAGAQHFDFAIK